MKSAIISYLEKLQSMTKDIGIEAVSQLYPNDFEVYMVALELVDSEDNTIDYLTFPIMPESISKVEPTRTNIKKSMSGVTVLTNPSFTPQEITIKGNFGRNFKIILGDNSSNSEFSTNAGKYDLYSILDQKVVSLMSLGEFNVGVKTGYGLIKILKAMISKSIGVDKKGLPFKLYFYNMALGESYLVAIPPSGAQFSQDISKNMIWEYNITMTVLAPLEAVSSKKKIVMDKLLPSLISSGVSEIASSVSDVIKPISSKAIEWL